MSSASRSSVQRLVRHGNGSVFVPSDDSPRFITLPCLTQSVLGIWKSKLQMLLTAAKKAKGCSKFVPEQLKSTKINACVQPKNSKCLSTRVCARIRGQSLHASGCGRQASDVGNEEFESSCQTSRIFQTELALAINSEYEESNLVQIILVIRI